MPVGSAENVSAHDIIIIRYRIDVTPSSKVEFDLSQLRQTGS
jgi:hypothetical protein